MRKNAEYIKSLNGLFYAEKSPVIITSVDLYRRIKTKEVFIYIKFKNLSDKAIKELTLTIQPCGAEGDVINGNYTHRFKCGKLRKNKIYKENKKFFIPERFVDEPFRIGIKEVVFSSGDREDLSNLEFISMPKGKMVKKEFQDDEKTAENDKKYGNGINVWTKLLLTVIAIAVLTLSAVIIFKQGYNIFKYAYEKGDYSLASKVYAWKTNSEDTMDAINDILQPEADKAYDDYNKSKIEYDDAKEIIERINEVSNNHFEDYNTKIDKLKSSKENFEKGKQLEQRNDYENALMAYQMVVADDTNYNDAQGGISRIKEKVHNDIIAQADKYVSNGNYKEGREYVAKNSGVLSADEQSKYKEKFDAQEKAEKERKELFDKCYNAYKNVLLSLKKENSAYKFAFAYINNDNIPDIFVTDGYYYAAGVRIYIYQNGMANKVTWTLDGETYDKFGTWGLIEYAPKSNMIRFGSERAEFKGTRFIKISGSKAEEKIWFLTERAYDPLTEEFVDSKYSISNKEVSKEEYVSQFNKTNNSYKWSNTPSYENLKNIDDNTIKNELKKYLK